MSNSHWPVFRPTIYIYFIKAEWPAYQNIQYFITSKNRVLNFIIVRCSLLKCIDTIPFLLLHGVTVRRCLQGNAPQYFVDCSPSRHQLIVPRHRRAQFGRRAFSIAGPTAWNSLPDYLRDPSLSEDTLKPSLKTILVYVVLLETLRNALYKCSTYLLSPCPLSQSDAACHSWTSASQSCHPTRWFFGPEDVFKNRRLTTELDVMTRWRDWSIYSHPKRQC